MKSKQRLIVSCLVAASAGVAIGMLFASGENEKFKNGVKNFLANVLSPESEAPVKSGGTSTAPTVFSNHG